jgi:amino acid adenylation domain-containing protein
LLIYQGNYLYGGKAMVLYRTDTTNHRESDADKTPSLIEPSFLARHTESSPTDLTFIDTDEPYSLSVPQAIAAQAARTPHAPALIADNQILSYQALNQRANQLAHYLQALGVRPEVPVGLCTERSLDMVVGLLAILKAGGAYVPLDPKYPPARLTYMLEDAGVPVLITQRHLAEQLQTRQARTICLDNEPALAEQSIENPPLLSTPDNLAYIIYTSGSTGQPKGVQITHKSLLNLISWHQQAFAVTAADRATQLASPAFDATGWELWPYLCCGASVYLVDEQIRTTLPALRDWLVRNKITIAFLPTPLAESVLALDWPPETALRYLLTGADMLHHYPPASLPFALVNNYGPTEATVVATSGLISPEEQTGTPPSIGRPIANTKVYILDEQLRQAAIGEPGELHIDGIGLARGYLNQPALTREKFIPHPFSSEPGARLYKTGDLARFLPDGQLAFMGRIDQQIKIRGYRIEPGEIVAALNSHPAIHISFVIAREDAAGDKQLVAYIVLNPGMQASPRTLQEAVKTRLPDYMIPATFVPLEALPLTPNGKVDRAALPPPDDTNILRDETEEKVAGVVASLLKVERVGVEENFFLLGGHSMLGAQLIAWIAETFSIELPLRALFEAPTVRQLSAEIERRLIAWLETMSEDEAQRLLV